MNKRPVIYWIRNDLRISDNPALTAAVASGQPVLPVYIWSPREEGHWAPGAASRAWLGRSLARLSEAYTAVGSRLILRRGDTVAVLCQLSETTGATAVHAGRRFEPLALLQEARVREALRTMGVTFMLHEGAVLNAPDAIETQAGEPYKVFTPYYKACLNREPVAMPLPAPVRLPAPGTWPASDALASLKLAPDHPWVDKVLRDWAIGEAAARGLLESFAESRVPDYPAHRDHPALPGTSRLSPYLHVGEISPRQVWHAISAYRGGRVACGSHEAYLRQLYWREFAHHLLYHFPQTPEEPLNRKFAPFPWRKDAAAMRRWQRGQTGYPIVDAGMRELWATGWMHNRVRMIVASFLAKDLRIHWREGANWFWDTLIDADLANNTLGWQWVAGCGADAAPYFRVFNPVTQGKKFDPDGAYVRRWIPELAAVPDKYVHCPWTMAPIELVACGVRLGKDYPHPMVDHDEARKEALAIYDELRALAR